jgi:hypothetical protein
VELICVYFSWRYFVWLRFEELRFAFAENEASQQWQYGGNGEADVKKVKRLTLTSTPTRPSVDLIALLNRIFMLFPE